MDVLPLLVFAVLLAVNAPVAIAIAVGALVFFWDQTGLPMTIYAQRLVAMRDGALVASGTPHEVLTEQLLAEVFELEARVVPDPVTGTPMVVPVRRLPGHHGSARPSR